MWEHRRGALNLPWGYREDFLDVPPKLNLGEVRDRAWVKFQHREEHEQSIEALNNFPSKFSETYTLIGLT